MKLINRRKAGKLVAYQIAMLIALMATQVGIEFSATHKYVGFESKTDSWYGVAMAAQGDRSACQIELDQLHASIQKQNEAGIKDIR